MHRAWTLVFLSARCRLTGTALAQVGARIPWNPLVIFKALQSVQSEVTRSLGVAVSGSVATALLAAGLTRVIVLQRRLGIIGRLSVLDKSAISILMFFMLCQLFEIGRVLLRDRAQLSVAQVVLW
ncbi:MAG: hypothetical protein DMG57_42195 [Acidobacteria bacterium]|nr:MAG: hypothetical protein DMG57_42195 [Acidobacteriota bacterium]